MLTGLMSLLLAAIAIKGNLMSTKEESTSNGTSLLTTTTIIEKEPKNAIKPIFKYNSGNSDGIVLMNEDILEIYKRSVSETFKIFINYLQINGIAIAINVKWSKAIKSFLQLIDFVSGISGSAVANTFMSIDCILNTPNNNNNNDSPLIMRKSIIRLYISIFWPLSTIFILILFWILMMIRYKLNLNYLKRRIFLSILVVFYISYINVTKSLVKALYCVKLNTENDLNKYVWLEDTYVECNHGHHYILLIYICIPLLLLFSLGFPLSIALLLIREKHKDHLHSACAYETLGFLYRSYDTKYVFWDAIIMLRKALLAIIVVFAYPLGGNQQVFYDFN